MTTIIRLTIFKLSFGITMEKFVCAQLKKKNS